MAKNTEYVNAQLEDLKDFIDKCAKLIKSDVPTKIKVTKKPNKTLYNVGDAIILTGIEVTAYLPNGYKWGLVPMEELRIDPTMAVAPESKSYTDTKTFGSVTVTNTPPDTKGVWYTYDNGINKYSELVTYSYLGYPGEYSPEGQGNHVWRYKNVFLRNSNVGGNFGGPFVYEYGNDPVTELLKSLGVEFGTFENTIEVMWARPGDGKILKTSFKIEAE